MTSITEAAADYLRRLAEASSDSPAAARWTAHHGIGGWYVEDDDGRIICTTDDASVARFIAANDPASTAG